MNLRRCLQASLAALALAVAAAPAGAKPLPAPPPEVAEMTLPEGRLVRLALSEASMLFQDLDRSEAPPGVLWFYQVGPVIKTDYGPSEQTVERYRVDCAARTYESLGMATYSAQGRMVMWLDPTDMAGSDEGLGAIALALQCDGQQPTSEPVLGHAAAFALGRAQLRD